MTNLYEFGQMVLRCLVVLSDYTFLLIKLLLHESPRHGTRDSRSGFRNAILLCVVGLELIVYLYSTSKSTSACVGFCDFLVNFTFSKLPLHA